MSGRSIITFPELHRVGFPVLVGRGDEGAPAAVTDGAPEPIGDVLTFALAHAAPARTYLDACREQGVYQEREEMLDEIARLKAEGFGQGDRPTPSKVSHIADRGPRTMQHAIDAEYARLEAAAAVIEASGIAGPRFRWIVAVLITARLDADAIPQLVAATFGDAILPGARHHEEHRQARGGALNRRRDRQPHQPAGDVERPPVER